MRLSTVKNQLERELVEAELRQYEEEGERQKSVKVEHRAGLQALSCNDPDTALPRYVKALELEPLVDPEAATTTAAEEEEVGMKYRVASKDGARMRAEADKASTPLHIIKSGTTVEVLDVCHVRSTPPAWLLVTEIGHKIVQGSSLSPCKTLHLVSRLTSVCAASGAAASRWHEAPACGRVQAWLLEAPGGLDFSQQARPEQSKWPAHRLGRADRT